MDGALNPIANDGFQAQGRAWDPMREDIVTLLRTAEQVAVQPIYYGSNHTFLVTLDAGESGRSFAVYKPARGEYPLYDFAHGTLYRREVASWLLDHVLGWCLVPPTVVARGQYGVGSLQIFIESYSQGEIELAELRRLALLDILLNNADRKSEHLLLGDEGKLWGIDHGLTFHAQPKLRTVLWHFAGEPLADEERSDLDRGLKALEGRKGNEADELRELLAPVEWRALLQRLRRLLETGRFPDPRYKAVPYRW